MLSAQQSKYYTRANNSERLTFLVVFVVICAIFAFLNLVSTNKIRISDTAGCSFERNYGIPCPTCRMTRSVKALMHGKILKSLYLQPAAAIGCILLAAVGFFSLLSAVLAVNFWFLPPVRLWPTAKILLFTAVLLAGGWAWTVAIELLKN